MFGFRTAARSFAAALAFAFATPAAPALADPWLFVSDVHLDLRNTRPQPAPIGDDTNEALLQSALAAMRRASPHPPVVVIGGDFLGHSFDYRFAVPTFQHLARAFDAAFPDAQFVIALGNEDSGCGDYALSVNGGFLDRVAAAWAPLVNRHGRAPRFRETFARDGFYVARLPLPNLQVVVIDDVFWSPRYHSCGPSANGGAQTLAELQNAVRGGTPSWVLLHIPPGIDAYSTAGYARRLFVVPFLDPVPRSGFEQIVTAPGARVPLAIAGHVHHFSYRILGAGEKKIPLLVLPAISPIFLNAPAFLTADVERDGTLRAAHEIAFDGTSWREIGSTNTLGLRSFTEPELAGLQRRLEHDEPFRATYDRLYTGGARPAIIWSNWRVYWCAADHLGASEFRSCMGQKGFSIFTRRGIALIVAAGVAVVALAAAVVVWAVRRRRRRRV